MTTQLKTWDNTLIYPKTQESKKYTYQGEKINIEDLQYNFSKELSLEIDNLSNTQGCTHWENYIFVARYVSSRAYLLVFNKTNGVLLATISLNINVHCNTVNFGNQYYNGNEIPVLYASEWDGNKRYYVFNIVKISETNWTASLIQTINTSSVSGLDAFGKGNSDLCIDRQKNLMYTITYKINSYDSSGNMYTVCKFNIPSITSNTSVTLSESDILDTFDVKCYAARQDFCALNGKIYLLAGLGKGQTTVADKQTYFIVIDTEKQSIVNEIIIDHLNEAIEPEGIYIENGYIFVTFQGDPSIYKFEF